jgi:tetratricopeptide (TPR) repeat protein
MLTPDHIELLERYSRKQLSENEITEVKNNILDNPELKEEAEGILQILQGFNAVQLENFQNQMANWEKKHENVVPLNHSNNNSTKEVKISNMNSFISKYRFAAAAVILVLLLPVGFMFFNSLNGANADKIFASAAEHYSAILLTSRAANDTVDNIDPLETLKTQAIEAYNAQNYSQALNQLNEYFSKAEEDKKTVELKLYIGLSYLFTGNTAEAKKFFQLVIQEGEKDNYREAAEWYLALSYLKEMNAQKSAELLQTISQAENHAYQSKASTLLPEVKTLKQ